jgi:hypothetical protein
MIELQYQSKFDEIMANSVGELGAAFLGMLV